MFPVPKRFSLKTCDPGSLGSLVRVRVPKKRCQWQIKGSPPTRPYLSPLLFCRYRKEPGSTRGGKEQCVNNSWVLNAKGVGQLLGAPRPPVQPCAFRGEWESGQPSKRLVYEAKAKVAAANSFNCLQGTAPACEHVPLLWKDRTWRSRMTNRQQYACRLPRGLAVATQDAVRPWFPQSRADGADRKSPTTCGSVPQARPSLSAKLSVKISAVRKTQEMAPSGIWRREK